jgi:ATP-dependent Clp protease adapter protein ClpS
VSDWTALGAAGALLAVVWATVAQVRARRADPALTFALAASAFDALHRRHSLTSLDHFALALLFDSDVAGMVRRAGGDPRAIRRRLDEHLVPALDGSPVAKATYAGDIRTVLRHSRGLRRAPSPARVLEEIARGPQCLARSLLPAATALAAARRSSRSLLVDCDSASGSAYRDHRGLTGDTQVRLFDDKKTSFEHVTRTLTGTFGLAPTCVRHVAFRVHQRGSAAIGPWPRDEAAKLVSKAQEEARSAGFPLRFMMEPIR